MSHRPVAGQIWAGRLRVVASITAGQDFDLVCGIVQDAVYFDFEDQHPGHGDEVVLTVGLCDDPVEGGRDSVLLFPAVVTVSDPDPGVEEALSLVAGLVQDAIDGWYEQPERLSVGFFGIDGGREVRK